MAQPEQATGYSDRGFGGSPNHCYADTSQGTVRAKHFRETGEIDRYLANKGSKNDYSKDGKDSGKNIGQWYQPW